MTDGPWIDPEAWDRSAVTPAPTVDPGECEHPPPHHLNAIVDDDLGALTLLTCLACGTVLSSGVDPAPSNDTP